MNGVSFGYETALATACVFNSLELTKYLVENGANITSEHVNGKDNLMPSYLNCDVFKYLIYNGAIHEGVRRY